MSKKLNLIFLASFVYVCMHVFAAVVVFSCGFWLPFHSSLTWEPIGSPYRVFGFVSPDWLLAKAGSDWPPDSPMWVSPQANPFTSVRSPLQTPEHSFTTSWLVTFINGTHNLTGDKCHCFYLIYYENQICFLLLSCFVSTFSHIFFFSTRNSISTVMPHDFSSFICHFAMWISYFLLNV